MTTVLKKIFQKYPFITGALIIFLYRLLSPKSTFPGFESDYGVHLSFARELFLSPNLVFQWPPIYKGLLLSHLLSWPFQALGLDVSRAMLLVFDFAVLSIILSLFRFQKHFEMSFPVRLSCIFISSVVLFSGIQWMAIQGFYAQLISAAFYVSFQTNWILKEFKSVKDFVLGAILLGLGALSYPDAFLWLAPLWVLGAIRADYRIFKFLSIFFVIGVFVLLWGQASVMHMDGGGGRGYFGIFVAMLLCGFASFRGLQFSSGSAAQRALTAFLVYVFFTTILILYSYLSFGEVLYYARKNTYFVFYFFPLLLFVLASESKKIKGHAITFYLVSLCVFLLSFAQFVPPTKNRVVDNFLRSRGAVSYADQIDFRTRSLSTDCAADEVQLNIPKREERAVSSALGPRIVRLIYMNSGDAIKIELTEICWLEGPKGYFEAAQIWSDNLELYSGKSFCVPKCWGDK
jgi:hypothetical protein